jgi:hypothetical protein
MQQGARGIGAIGGEFPVAVAARRKRIAKGLGIGVAFLPPLPHSAFLRISTASTASSRSPALVGCAPPVVKNMPCGFHQVGAHAISRDAELYLVSQLVEVPHLAERKFYLARKIRRRFAIHAQSFSRPSRAGPELPGVAARIDIRRPTVRLARSRSSSRAR